MKFFATAGSILLVVALGGAVVFGVWSLEPKLPDYIERRHAMFNDREVTFLMVNLTKGGYELQLFNRPDDAKSVEAWREDLGADIVFNAAYFNDENEPSGFFSLDGKVGEADWPTVEEQKELASYSFYVEIDGGELDFKYLPNSPVSAPPQTGFLSFPTLTAMSLPVVKEDSGQYAERTMLAMDGMGDAYVILTEEGSVSLYEAAQWLWKQPEGFSLAGNLDGGPSTGISIENGDKDIEDVSAYVPSVIAGFKKSE